MEKSYFLRRELAELKAAKSAVCSEARLAHWEMAGRYGVKAAGSRDRNERRRLSETHREEAERCRQLALSVTAGPGRTFLDHAATLYDEMAISATKNERRFDARR